jgi:cytochrome c-type biogenesis protein
VSLGDVLGDVATSFVLGLLTPLTALCVIPLYPAFLSRLSRNVSKEHDNRRLFALFGLVVVAGVIVFMALLGLIFTMLLQESLTRVIGIISPIAFAAMAVIGVLLMFNVKIQRKVRPNKLRNPYVSAFFYGFFFGAIVVPCNPLFIAAFFARVATVEGFVVNMLNFLAFGLGIGAPLLAFSLVSRATSRSMVNWLVKYNRQIDFVAGLVMVSVAVYYLIFVFHVFDRFL